MILTTTRHGRTGRDTRYLLAHLAKQDGQHSRVVTVAAPVAMATEALAYMEALRDGSNAKVAYHHVSLNPSASLADEQRDEAVARILFALGAEDHAYVLWEHSGKDRRGRDVDTHYHLIVAHVGPGGRALNDSRSFVRLEAAARSLEVDFGHDLTVSRRTAAVAAELDLQGRPDVAGRIRGAAPPEPPQSTMSSRQRARAERQGVSLSDVREAVRQAWQQSDTPAALRAALSEHGLSVTAGDKSGVWIVIGSDGVTLGALDRLSGERRKTVAARMQQEISHDTDSTARNASLESDLRPGAPEPGSSRVLDPFAGAVGAAAVRGIPAGPGDRFPDGDSQYSGKDAGSDRGTRGPHRRADTAVAIAVLARAAGNADVRARARRLRRPYRLRAADILDTHRLARIDLDEILFRALALGRRAEALTLRLRLLEDERATLLRRLRAAAERPITFSREAEVLDPSPPAYRPGF